MTAFKFSTKPITKAFRAIAREVRFRHESRALSELNDRMLEDIGFVRGQIEYELRHGRSFDR